MNAPRLSPIARQYDFRWDVLDVIISGKSSIDSDQGFSITNVDEATRFIASYGFDLSNPIEAAEVLGHFHEALNFIRKNFLQPENPEGLKLDIPRRIVELTDVRDLFLMSAMHLPGQPRDISGLNLRNWACSILKVMHTIAHIDQDLRSGYFADIQKQILDRFYRNIQRGAGGKLFLGESPDDIDRIPLIAFETKPKKSRESTLIKLLHKPENVAEDIFDRVGVRLITETRLGALRTIKYLKDRMIVVPPNIKPSRSRNTLIDLEDFRVRITESLRLLENRELTDEQFLVEVENAAHPLRVDPSNPHSSEFYRSIQFTCRHLIKLTNPLFNDMKELKNFAKAGSLSEEAKRVIDRVDMKYLQKEVRFFYPYEVQVVDIKSHEENERGRSAHSEYKRAQLNTAMKRVMGALADASR